MFTGTLIEDLIATVERVEQTAQTHETSMVGPWLAAIQEDTDYDSKFFGVA